MNKQSNLCRNQQLNKFIDYKKYTTFKSNKFYNKLVGLKTYSKTIISQPIITINQSRTIITIANITYQRTEQI